MFIPAELIKRKRDGKELSSAEIKSFVDAFVSGEAADYQMSAFLMATCLKGFSKSETWALTDAMIKSGEVADLSSVKGVKVDKHSTGGVGDKTSLILGPIAAAVGVKVPMMSGRGLGHTGGTLDKLESMKGFRTQLSLEQFAEQTEDLGLCFIGQTAEICPADKRMYALRDVTGTVESIPLICASIMSKKIAEGIDGLVLDVKVGLGAFMKKKSDAVTLAQNLMEIARAGKKSVTALITQMDEPLGFAVGNSLEVQECVEVMSGRGPNDVRELSVELAAHMILLAGKAKNIAEARRKSKGVLDSGEALAVFDKVVRRQGGRLEFASAREKKEVLSTKSGYVYSLNAEKVGLASLSLGAGRIKSTDQLDPSAGIVVHKKTGDKVEKTESLATLYYNSNFERCDETAAESLVVSAYSISKQKPKSVPIILKVMGPRFQR